jgi:RES domain
MAAFTSWMDYIHFCQTVRRRYRFVQQDSVASFLATLIDTCSSRRREIPAKFPLWRAQLGNATSERQFDDTDQTVVIDDSVPFSSARMKPPRNSALEGRVNAKGIPCLYLATDKDTAMAEVRPWLGAKISTGYFETTRALAVLDFSVGYDSEFDPNLMTRELSAAEKEADIWAQVDRAFSAPVINDPSTAEYIPTQIIAETFRNCDYDGVVYKSLLGTGFNFALFDLDAAEILACSLYRCMSTSFSFDEDGQNCWTRR